LAYFVGGEVGYALSLGPAVGGTFWPPSGISLAVFLIAPRRLWLQLVIGGVLANYVSDALHGQTLPASIGFAIANLSEPLVGAFLLRRIFTPPVTVMRLQELVALALVVVFVSAPIGAVIGALAAELWTVNPPGLFAGWRTWWVGDAVGALVLTPCVLRIMAGWRQMGSVPPRTWLEAVMFALTLVAVTRVVFTALPTSLAVPFLVFPVLLWGSLRFGPIGVGGALCLVVLLTAHGTAAGQGPFAAEQLSLGDRLVALQIYVGVMAISFHGLGVLWEERARTAAALRLAHSGLEARYRRIVEQSPLAILAIERDGRVREANPAWQKLWTPVAGTREPTFEDRPWEDSRLKPLLDRAFAGEIVELPERALDVPVDSPAATRRVQGFAYPVKDEAGNVGEVVLIERDVTGELEAQKQLLDANRTLRDREEALSQVLQEMAEAQAHREELLEAERFARGEAERASQLKDEFLATLSHELRTPLNAIVGWAHILRRTSNDPALAQAVGTIERNAKTQAKLIEDLLDMSRIMAGKVGLTLARVRLAEIVTAAADALRPVADAKGVHLSIDIAAAADAWVSGDAARLQQVVTNLLGNGIKFTPAGGRVEVRVTARASDAQILVRDTGQGIPEQFLPSVFERFRQADGSITRRHGGLGLGLSIAKHIVEMHGGAIAAASDGVDKGATFTVTLPLAENGPARDAVIGEGLPLIVLTGLRVLIVDDEADARELLCRLFTEQGCEVAVAASAEEALNMLGARSYDVLLSDIGMPGTDGYELLRRVRANIEAVPKAFAVTAFARPEDRERALAAGFDGHFAKPVNTGLLMKTMAELARTLPLPRHAKVPPLSFEA
jgi:signal transduction histidine kinase/CheY-like chemotaxis protein